MSDGYLVVCATPIGNLGDLSPRLAETLGEVDLVYAEDTRRTAKLLSHIGVTVPTRSLFTGNEVSRTAELVDEIRAGRKVALVSDAGMPTISDPGAEAVRMARESGLEVRAVPGPSAVTLAIALSGMGGDRFVFEGFLPRRGSERHGRLLDLAREPRPAVIFASPHRVGSDLLDLARTCGEDRRVAVLREMTKIHEEIWIGPLGEAAERYGGEAPRGELTLVLAPAQPTMVSLEQAVADAGRLVDSGQTLSAAAREIAEVSGVSRREIYEELLMRQDRN